MSRQAQKIITIGITGASGSIYAIRLVEELVKLGHRLHLIISEAGWQVFSDELGWDTQERAKILEERFGVGRQSDVYYHGLREFSAPIASGSYRSDGMVIVPCSMGTLSAIAHGASNNLLERAADVMLKEGNKLILVPRETPLNQIHLENMLKVAQAGGKILPAMPAFYHLPQSMEDLIDFVVGKILDALDIEHSLFRRWGDNK